MRKKQGCFTTIQKLILASASPRRADFFRKLGLTFRISGAAIDESLKPGEIPTEFVKRLATEKAKIIAGDHPGAWVVGADTVVVLDNKILGKPDSPSHAEEMLQQLSGRWHEVRTGFTICGPGGEISRAVMTRVCFIKVFPELIHSYVLTGEPLDKAGSYGIQGLGGVLVREIKGSYSNVIGLPLAEVVEAMLKLRIITPDVSLS